ncbi:MAG TPA: lactate racemase domain-containing protein [Gemmatales bacterium]|nr:lactate racemase domain-containing protein [Gemmatales bacterium]
MTIIQRSSKVEQLEMWPIQQKRNQPVIQDIKEHVGKEIRSSIRLQQLPASSRIAVAVGSRGIKHLAIYVRTTLETLKAMGHQPFVVAAMGSHGGATSEGQRALLAHYGVHEEALGVPVHTEMEVEQIGVSASGIPVYWDKNALRADGVITISRIKPHTDFQGTYESGIVKMMVIGLGKQAGASVHHAYGVRGLRDFIPQSAQVVLEKTKFLAGLAIVENADDEPGCIEFIDREEVLLKEPGLLSLARAWMGQLPFPQLDLLIIGECGKNYSGTGMDVNVLGRQMLEGVQDVLKPNITRICLLDLSEETEGNATGIGIADLVTERLVKSIDKVKSDMNCLTSCCLLRSKIPIDLPSDRECIEQGLLTCWQPVLDQVKLAIIPNTLELSHIWATKAACDSVRNNKELCIGTESIHLPWTGDRLNQKLLFPESTQGRRSNR